MNMFMDGGGGMTNMAVLRRRKVWEIDLVFRCPVVGMCLSVREQRLLCRKVGAAEHAKSDFAIHEMVVATMSAENPLSRKLDALLARKYEANFVEHLGMPEDVFLRAWAKGLEAGECAGLLWAAAVRNLTYSAMSEVFGSLHMTMHEHAKAYGALKSARNDMDERNSRLGVKVKELEKANRKLAMENDELRMALSASKTEAALPEQGQRTTSPVTPLQESPHDQARLLGELHRKLEASNREMTELQQTLREERKNRMRVEEEFSAHLVLDAAMRKACSGESCRGEECTPRCPSFDLCEKRVLIVGGIERMGVAYRKFVEDRGGIFEYHAGRMKSGSKALEHSVQRADLVLCPVNCNSHGACLMVKSLGKKYKKPVHMLRNFSLSTLARTVDQICDPPPRAFTGSDMGSAISKQSQLAENEVNS